jgi:outer membrane protein, heavy metal efflux system
MKLRTILILITAIAGLAAEEPGQDQSGTNVIVITPMLITELADEASDRSLSLRAADARVEAARANTRSIRTWEDPMVEAGAMAARKMMRAEDGDIIYGIEQPLPLWGKPKAARAVADAEVRREEAEGAYQFQMLRRDIAVAVFDLARIDEIIGISRQDLSWLQTLVEVTEQRYAAGNARQSELLRLQTEHSRRADQLRTELRMRAQVEFKLNRLLNRALSTSWPQMGLPPLAEPISYSDRLGKMAVQNEPRLKVMEQEIRQSEAAVELTRRQRYPNVNVGAEMRNYSGDGSWRQGMLTLSFNLPWGNARKYRTEVERDEAKVRAARLDREDYELAVLNEIHELTVGIDAARREAVLYREEVLPRIELALEVERAAYQANRGMFVDLMEARRLLLEAQTSLARAVAEQYQLMSELVLCCGLGDLEALEMFASEKEPPLSDPSQPDLP